METFILMKSDKKEKKWMIIHGEKKIHFGQKGFSDFTLHKDPKRKKNYIARHEKREDWNKSGINTAGFWAKHLLWNKPDLKESIKDTEKNFNIKIKFKKNI